MPTRACTSRSVGTTRCAAAGDLGHLALALGEASKTPSRTATISVRANANARWVSTSGVGTRPARSASHSSGVSGTAPSLTGGSVALQHGGERLGRRPQPVVGHGRQRHGSSPSVSARLRREGS
jgi:hypothetical protein